MSDFGLFEASTFDAEAQQRTAAADALAAAVYDAREKFGEFLGGAEDVRDFRDRIALCKDDLIKTIEPHIFPRTGVVRRVAKQLEREFVAARKTSGEILDPEGDFHGYLDDVSGNDREKVDANVFVGDGTPHTGDPADTVFVTPKESRRRQAGPFGVQFYPGSMDDYFDAVHQDHAEQAARRSYEEAGEDYDKAMAEKSFANLHPDDVPGYNHPSSKRLRSILREHNSGPAIEGREASSRQAGEHSVDLRGGPVRTRYSDPTELPETYSDAVADEHGVRDLPALGKHRQPQHDLGTDPYPGSELENPPKLYRGDPEYPEPPQMRRVIRRKPQNEAIEHFGSWCRAKNVRPSLNTLDRYASRGLPDRDYFAIVSAMQRAAAPDYLQKANDALMGLLNQEAETFQEQIAPMQQALQVVQQALTEQQQANPFNVMPGGSINVMPGADQGAAPGGLPSQDPSMGGGMPPMDPSMMGGGDPSAMGADPSMGGGAPPMDPSMMGGPPPQDPSQQQMLAKRGGRRKGRAAGSGVMAANSSASGVRSIRHSRVSTPVRTADVVKEWEEWNAKQPQRGTLPTGSDADFDQFSQETGAGQRALKKLRNHLYGPKQAGIPIEKPDWEDSDANGGLIAAGDPWGEDIDLGGGWTQNGIEGDVRHPAHPGVAAYPGPHGYVVYHDEPKGNLRSGPFPDPHGAIDYILGGGKPQHVFTPSSAGGSWKSSSYVGDLQAAGENNADQGIRNRFERGHWERIEKADGDAEKSKVRGASRKQAWMGWGGGKAPHHKVAGWEWDDHLNAHVANKPTDFACTCGSKIAATGGFQICGCGKQWNSYVIGTGGDRKEASAEKYLVREIPVREGVIVAARTADVDTELDESIADEEKAQDDYADRASDAEDAGRDDVADRYREIEGDEAQHEKEFRALESRFAQFVADAYVARESALTKLTDPGEITETEDTGTPTMKPMPSDWARRNPDGKWNKGPAKAVR